MSIRSSHSIAILTLVDSDIYESTVEDLDFTDFDCLKCGLSEGLGLGIDVGGSVIKFYNISSVRLLQNLINYTHLTLCAVTKSESTDCLLLRSGNPLLRNNNALLSRIQMILLELEREPLPHFSKDLHCLPHRRLLAQPPLRLLL